MSNKRNEMIKIGVNKAQLKEYIVNFNNVVYLNDGDEFQIKLFNPFSFILGAKILINGELLSNILVIKPGETIWLERYLNSDNKFKYSTYHIEDGELSNNACKFNGEVIVKFYKECKDKKSEYVSSPNTNFIDNKLFETTSSQRYGSHGLTLNKSLSSQDISVSYYSHLNTLDEYNVKCANNSLENGYSTSSQDETKEYKETGIIEPGSYSYQRLNTDYRKFNTNDEPFVYESVKILPMSEKQFSSSDLHKIYCHDCRRKMKHNYKYCPFCGVKL